MNQSALSATKISPSTTPFFYNEVDAVGLLRAVRWPESVCCPRCGSTNVREVETTRAVEVLSCRDCRYNFSSVADSFFHGSSRPVHEQLRLIAISGLEPETSFSRLARFLGWKATTVSLKLKEMRRTSGAPFMLRSAAYTSFEHHVSVMDYLEQPGVEILHVPFRDRVARLLKAGGRTLRRKQDVPSPDAAAGETSFDFAGLAPSERKALVAPASLPYLRDDDAAYELVQSLRWDNTRRSCPRCHSPLVLPAGGKAQRDLLRCADCGHRFNALAGTIFQGTKMPIYKFLQFFVIFNALDERLRMRDICFVLDCTFKTASIWMDRGRYFRSDKAFAYASRHVEERGRSLKKSVLSLSSDPFAAFCDLNGILINEAYFFDYAKRLCRPNVWRADP